MSGGDEEIEIEDLPEDILPFKKPDFYGEESTGYGNENREFGVSAGILQELEKVKESFMEQGPPGEIDEEDLP